MREGVSSGIARRSAAISLAVNATYLTLSFASSSMNEGNACPCGLRLAAIAAGAGTCTQQHKSTKFADQNDGARAFKLSLRLLAYGTLTEISVELYPNGNRLVHLFPYRAQA